MLWLPDYTKNQKKLFSLLDFFKFLKYDFIVICFLIMYLLPTQYNINLHFLKTFIIYMYKHNVFVNCY